MELSDGMVINLSNVVWVSWNRTSIKLSNDEFIVVTRDEGRIIRNTLIRWGKED